MLGVEEKHCDDPPKWNFVSVLLRDSVLHKNSPPCISVSRLRRSNILFVSSWAEEKRLRHMLLPKNGAGKVSCRIHFLFYYIFIFRMPK